MSTDLAVMPNQSITTIDNATLEKLVATGDLSGLTAEQRTSYYQARCNACGLDPASQPFEYLRLNGKLILYAKKTATDQLARLHGISIQILDRRSDPATGIYEVTCRVTFPDGRIGEDVAAIHLGKLQGEALSNAIMKCVTKAKRRTILASCGLGMLDEIEVDSIPRERKVRVHIDPADGNLSHIDGEIIEPPQKSAPGLFTKEHVKVTEKFNAWVTNECGRVNHLWHDQWDARVEKALEEGLAAPARIDDLINPWQAKNHLMKWAIETGRLSADIKVEAAKTRQTDAYVAWVAAQSDEDKAALKAEMGRYVAEQGRLKTAEIYRKNPDLAPDGYAEEQSEAAEPEHGDAYEGPDEAMLGNPSYDKRENG